MIAVMFRLERVQRRLVERRREAWKAAGGVDAYPDDYIGHGGGFSSPAADAGPDVIAVLPRWREGT